MSGLPLGAIAAVVFAAGVLAIWAVFMFVRSRTDRLARRLGRIRSGEAGVEALSPEVVALAAEPAYGAEAMLVQAGYRHPRSVLIYRCVQGVLALVLVGVAWWLSVRQGWAGRNAMMAMGAAALAGILLPHLLVSLGASGRRKKVRVAVPSALDLIIVCVEAGLGLNAAIQRVAREMWRTYPDLSRELAVLDQEIFLGASRADAFHHMAQRTGVDELRSLATVLMQSDRMGTSVAHVLRVQAATIREKRRQMIQEIAHKMPTKLVFPLVLFIFPELLLFLLGPAVLTAARQLTEVGIGK